MLTRLMFVLIVIAISTQWANAQSIFGSIVGVVKDPGGLVVAGAKITLSSLEDLSTRGTVSDGDGALQFMNVREGRLFSRQRH